MKTCLIAPAPDLEKYASGSEYHLLLAHLLDASNTPTGRTYTKFYKGQGEQGKFLTIDNGAKENGVGVGLPLLLDLAQTLKAKEVVLTDVRFKGWQTVEAGTHELKWLQSKGGHESYQNAGCPRLMVVPQGDSPTEWAKCLNELVNLATGAFSRIEGAPPTPTVGIPYHYDHLFDAGLYPLLKHPALSGCPIHLLGWTRRLESLQEIANGFSNIRSVDSSRPFVYAKSGLMCGEQEYPQRTEQYFDEPIPPVHDAVVRANIETFKRYARDV